MNLLLAAAGIAAFVYGSLLAALYLLQERIIFLPERLPAQHRFDFGADVHERWIEVPGARLNALHLKSPSARGIVFYLHGNAGNLQSWFGDAAFYREQGFDLFMLDYRGYGKSSGHIHSEADLHGAVLIVHGARDEVIAAAHGRSLQALVPQARLVIVPAAGHGDVQDFPQFHDAVAAALRAL